MVESLKFKSGEEKGGEEKGKQKSHTIVWMYGFYSRVAIFGSEGISQLGCRS